MGEGALTDTLINGKGREIDDGNSKTRSSMVRKLIRLPRDNDLRSQLLRTLATFLTLVHPLAALNLLTLDTQAKLGETTLHDGAKLLIDVERMTHANAFPR